ncbi:hypothetical protein [Streptomyces sp. CT34]|uniref:hypothetical protein n=1 Tax=Streptomyces sp. CT34 TaxID=1553907 RepID=UPI00068D7F48|nr:hypothetical protein [Streptomyces sp. CT34]
MAYENSSSSQHLSALPHPLAKPGFGKRSAPGQRPARPCDFAHLPRREASVAAYLDQLPEGADISVKTLAKVLPDYGQCALRTVRRRLSEAGHLRQFTEHLMSDDGSQQWVTRTYFSRTPRDDAWWAALRAGNVPTAAPASPSADRPQEEPPDAPEDDPPPAPRPQRPYSRAYALLASLGRTEPRMTLSAADCTALEAYAEEWLARGASPEQVLAALTAGLPPRVHHPGRFAHRRLVDKLPPMTAEAARERPPGPGAGTGTGPGTVSGLGPPGALDPPTPLRMMECTVCGVPGLPAALPGGICGACRGEAPPDRGPARLPPAQVRAHAEQLRALHRVSAPSRPQVGTAQTRT